MTDVHGAAAPRPVRVAATLTALNADLTRIADDLPHLAHRDAALVDEHLRNLEHTIEGLRSRLDWLWWRSTGSLPKRGAGRA